jgi:hypothetical protein
MNEWIWSHRDQPAYEFFLKLHKLTFDSVIYHKSFPTTVIAFLQEKTVIHIPALMNLVCGYALKDVPKDVLNNVPLPRTCFNPSLEPV